FGLSGTGKTSLSVHHFWLESGGEKVVIRQDDFFVLDNKAKAYGTEDNAYIKTEGLESEGQPLLYQGAMRESAVLENVFVDPKSRKVDFFRYDHPFTPNKRCLNGRGIVVRSELLDENGVPQADEKIDLESVDLVFFITRRDTIVPPLARLHKDQAAAFFMLGESVLTSAADPVKAGQSVREVGTNPFIVGPGGEEGNIFHDICEKNPNMQCFLLNTGGFGGRNFEIARGKLSEKEFRESVDRYSKGIEHPKAGGSMRVKFGGKDIEYRIRLVKVEAEFGGNRIKDQKALGQLLDEARKGDVESGKVDVFEYAQLTGDKITVRDSCTIIREIARGTVQWKNDEHWGYEIATEIPGVDMSRFDWAKYYSKEEHDSMVDELRKERRSWLAKFPELKREIIKTI
ncbi:MAG: phosphoenolpyruvate carboxykinase (ATP), partial [Candidatus Micrarchaeota archaeon]